MAVRASFSFIGGTQEFPFFLQCWSLQNEGKQHGPRNIWNYKPQDTVTPQNTWMSSCNKDMRVQRSAWAAAMCSARWQLACGLVTAHPAVTRRPNTPTATAGISVKFRTGNLLGRTCRLLQAAALFSLEHFCPLVRWWTLFANFIFVYPCNLCHYAYTYRHYFIWQLQRVTSRRLAHLINFNMQ
jgi:hypothetical protein